MTDTSQRLDIILVKLHSPERKLRYILCFNLMCETCITNVALNLVAYGQDTRTKHRKEEVL